MEDTDAMFLLLPVMPWSSRCRKPQAARLQVSGESSRDRHHVQDLEGSSLAPGLIDSNGSSLAVATFPLTM